MERVRMESFPYILPMSPNDCNSLCVPNPMDVVIIRRYTCREYAEGQNSSFYSSWFWAGCLSLEPRTSLMDKVEFLWRVFGITDGIQTLREKVSWGGAVGPFWKTRSFVEQGVDWLEVWQAVFFQNKELRTLPFCLKEPQIYQHYLPKSGWVYIVKLLWLLLKDSEFMPAMKNRYLGMGQRKRLQEEIKCPDTWTRVPIAA